MTRYMPKGMTKKQMGGGKTLKEKLRNLPGQVGRLPRTVYEKLTRKKSDAFSLSGATTPMYRNPLHNSTNNRLTSNMIHNPEAGAPTSHQINFELSQIMINTLKKLNIKFSPSNNDTYNYILVKIFKNTISIYYYPKSLNTNESDNMFYVKTILKPNSATSTQLINKITTKMTQNSLNPNLHYVEVVYGNLEYEEGNPKYSEQYKSDISDFDMLNDIIYELPLPGQAVITLFPDPRQQGELPQAQSQLVIEPITTTAEAAETARKEEEAATEARQVAEEEAEAARRQAEEAEAALRQAEEAEAERLKAEEERRQAEEAEAARRQAEEAEVARRQAAEAEAAEAAEAAKAKAARRQAEETEAAALRQAEEEAAAQRQAEEEAAAQRQAEETEAARRQAEEAEAQSQSNTEAQSQAVSIPNVAINHVVDLDLNEYNDLSNRISSNLTTYISNESFGDDSDKKTSIMSPMYSSINRKINGSLINSESSTEKDRYRDILPNMYTRVVLKDTVKLPHNYIHIHYTAWPDHGVPTKPDDNRNYDYEVLHKIIEQLFEYKKGNTHINVLVHCSAGVGRTGTFIMMCYLYNEIIINKKNNNEITIIDIFKAILLMRILRNNFMVQTIDQFQYIIGYMNYLNTISESSIVKIDPIHNTPTQPDHKNTVNIITTAINIKNTTSIKDYINANYINNNYTTENDNPFSFFNKIIAAQGPLSNTINDFNQMIAQEEITHVIMVTNFHEYRRSDFTEKCNRYFTRVENDTSPNIYTVPPQLPSQLITYIPLYFTSDNLTGLQLQNIVTVTNTDTIFASSQSDKLYFLGYIVGKGTIQQKIESSAGGSRKYRSKKAKKTKNTKNFKSYKTKKRKMYKK